MDEELVAEAETAWSQREWNIQHVLFPSMRLFLKPPKCMATDGTFVQVSLFLAHTCMHTQRHVLSGFARLVLASNSEDELTPI